MGRLVFDLRPFPVWGTETPDEAEEHNRSVTEFFARHYPSETPAPCDCGYYEPVHVVRCCEAQRRYCRRDAQKRLQQAYRERHLKALRQKRVCPVDPFHRAPRGRCWWCGGEMPRTKKGSYVARVYHNGKNGEPRCGYHRDLHTHMLTQRSYLLKRRGIGCASCAKVVGGWSGWAKLWTDDLVDRWMRGDSWMRRRMGEDVAGPMTLISWNTGLEVDHIVALALVAHLPDHERRPYFGPINLQALCSDCHKAKTRQDRAKIRALQRELEAEIKAAAETNPSSAGGEADPDLPSG